MFCVLYDSPKNLLRGSCKCGLIDTDIETCDDIALVVLYREFACT